MAFDMDSTKIYCYKCGTAFSRRQGYFVKNYSASYKGIGYLPLCRDCIDRMYNMYLAECEDDKLAMRQMCRKLDLYWSMEVYNLVVNKASPRTLISQYLTKLTTSKYVGLCYDDTLKEEGNLWNYPENENFVEQDVDTHEEIEEERIPPKYIKYWGDGYTLDVYKALEAKRDKWVSGLPGESVDVSTEAIIKQLCLLEEDIDKARSKGKSVDKLLGAYNTLLGSANLKPVQKKQEEEDAGLERTPLGVWLYRYENKRPLPEVDEDCKDVNHLRKYIFIWMGHLCKMLGLKNSYEQLYQDEIDRLRVEKPEYDGDDDEAFMMNMMDGDTDE